VEDVTRAAALLDSAVVPVGIDVADAADDALRYRDVHPRPGQALAEIARRARSALLVVGTAGSTGAFGVGRAAPGGSCARATRRGAGRGVRCPTVATSAHVQAERELPGRRLRQRRFSPVSSFSPPIGRPAPGGC
jgi:hypothetical protein